MTKQSRESYPRHPSRTHKMRTSPGILELSSKKHSNSTKNACKVPKKMLLYKQSKNYYGITLSIMSLIKSISVCHEIPVCRILS